MSKIRNLPLAVRLAGAFGALTVALVIVAFTGVHAMDGLSGKSSDLANKNLRAAELLGDLQQRSKDNVALVEQHLYVFDGDLANEDRIAADIQKNDAANAKADAQLHKLLGGTAVWDEYERFDGLREKIETAEQTAVRRSRGETVRKADERDGSRNYFGSTVLPLDNQLEQAGTALI